MESRRSLIDLLSHRAREFYQDEGARTFVRSCWPMLLTLRASPHLPELQLNGAGPVRPISFVVVQQSAECAHNALASPCVQDSMNQRIVIDNAHGLYWDSPAAAVNAGMEQARHDLVALIREDVYLPNGWHARVERALAELERFDPAWGVVSAAGWSASGMRVGHWSEPARFLHTFTDDSKYVGSSRSRVGRKWDAWCRKAAPPKGLSVSS